jgi:hypothetical protein
MKRIFINSILVSIGLLSFIMHYKHFTKDIVSFHYWRQAQTVSNIINFYEEDMNILNPRRNDRGNTDGLYRMEFPLMQWLVACLYKVFGNHLWICRLFMFFVGLGSVFGIYKLLAAIFNNKTIALMGAWAFNFSPCFYYYTINPMPDNLALCFSIWGITMFFEWYQNGNLKLLILSSFLLSLGASCKLPFILYFSVPFTYFLIQVFQKGIIKKFSLYVLISFGFILLPVAWYVTVIPNWNGNIVIKGVLDNHETMATMMDYYKFILISWLPEIVLNYGSVLFFLAGFFFIIRNKVFRDSRFVLFFIWGILVLGYYFYEANAIQKVHDYYLFPFYPLLFVIVAYGAYNLFMMGIPFFRYLTMVLLMILPLTCYIRMKGRWDLEKQNYNKDLLVYKEGLRNAVPKNSLIVAGNDISHYIFFYYVDKKGWGFDNDYLTAQQLKSMIEKGAEYLYTDSRKIDNNKEIMELTDKLVAEKGSIRIYSLKKHL